MIYLCATDVPQVSLICSLETAGNNGLLTKLPTKYILLKLLVAAASAAAAAAARPVVTRN